MASSQHGAGGGDSCLVAVANRTPSQTNCDGRGLKHSTQQEFSIRTILCLAFVCFDAWLLVLCTAKALSFRSSCRPWLRTKDFSRSLPWILSTQERFQGIH